MNSGKASAEPGLGCQVWSLERYARLTSSEKSQNPSSSEWEYFDNAETSLDLTLVSTGQLLIHQGRKQLESLCLPDLAADLKGVSRGDSLMVIWKIQSQSHRFRVKFSAAGEVSGEGKCRDCVDRLVQYFPVKIPGQASMEQSQVSSLSRGTPDKQVLAGDITLAQMAEAIVKPSSASLPSIYSELSTDPGVDLTTLIKLCLSDPTFPAFVDQVEEAMKKITSDLPS